ncbi:hypothetical protein RUM44_008760 [Polyplax serrata]|uniref:Uncharacterized protein n=1 Tax=Polyplax serrata TaxID=468196 RepID=A0ABR1B960_POLSC
MVQVPGMEPEKISSQFEQIRQHPFTSFKIIKLTTLFLCFIQETSWPQGSKITILTNQEQPPGTSGLMTGSDRGKAGDIDEHNRSSGSGWRPTSSSPPLLVNKEIGSQHKFLAGDKPSKTRLIKTSDEEPTTNTFYGQSMSTTVQVLRFVL